jgi:hypothetical protein
LDEQIIVGSRGKIALALLGCAAFIAVSIGILVGAPNDVYRGLTGVQIAWLGIVTFGIFFVMGAAQLIRPNRLTLTATGFRYDGVFFRARTVLWRDVDHFYLRKMRSASWVAYQLRVDPSKAPLVGLSLGPPRDPALGGVWPMKPSELLELLESYRSRFSGPA